MFRPGDITMRGGIRRLDGDSVVFEDGQTEQIDVIIWSTGYKISFPVLRSGLPRRTRKNRLPLFKRVIKPGIPNLFFIGLAQPSVTLFAIANRQAKWIAAYLAGEYSLPGVDEQKSTILADEKRHMSRYYKSARHTMQLDQDIYFAELDREMQRGKKRARALGFNPARPPVPRRADWQVVSPAE